MEKQERAEIKKSKASDDRRKSLAKNLKPLIPAQPLPKINRAVTADGRRSASSNQERRLSAK